LSLLKVLAKAPPALPNGSAALAGDVTPAAANVVQVSAQAALNATGLPAVNQAIAQLVISFETYTKQNPKKVVYAVMLAGAGVAVAAILPEAAVAALPTARALLLASSLQWFIGTSALTEGVTLTSYEFLSFAVPVVLEEGCDLLRGEDAAGSVA